MMGAEVLILDDKTGQGARDMSYQSTRERREVLRQRIQLRLDALGVNADQLAKLAGIGNTAVYDILAGRNHNPTLRALELIAKACKCSLAYLLGESDNLEGGSGTGLLSIPVLGGAEVGAYKVSMRQSLSPNRIFAPAHRKYPLARSFAIIIEDDSLAGLKPLPGAKGAAALVVDMADARLQIESNRVYYIQRRDSTGKVEKAFWRAVVERDEILFCPLFKSDERNEQLSWKIPRLLVIDRDSEVFVEGLFYGLIGHYDYYDQLAPIYL